MNPKDFRKYVIEPTLTELNMHSESAVNLLMGTVAQESNFNYLKQITGPALGIYQCEPTTHRDIWVNYLSHRNKLSAQVKQFATQRYTNQIIPDSELFGNLYYATVICRIHYYRKPFNLPGKDDVKGLARAWKEFYNTELGKGTEEEFIDNYHRYVLS